MKKNNKALKTFVYALLIGYCLITLLPFVWSILTSLKSTAEIAAGNTFFPEMISTKGYETIFASKLPIWLLNSFGVAAIVTILNIVLNTMAGYALARIDFKGRNVLFSFLLLLLMIPGQVTMIPLYMIVSRFGLIDTHASLILTSMISISYIFLMRQFFVNFPKEVEEAATMDGLSKIGTFFKVVLPNARPALATQAIFIFMGVWNEFMRPLLFITSPDKYLLTQGLNALAKTYKNATQWDVIMAGALISIIPIIILYIFTNKYFVTKNDAATGGKE